MPNKVGVRGTKGNSLTTPERVLESSIIQMDRDMRDIGMSAAPGFGRMVAADGSAIVEGYWDSSILKGALR